MLKSKFNQNELSHFIQNKLWRIKWLDGRGIELGSADSVGGSANQYQPLNNTTSFEISFRNVYIFLPSLSYISHINFFLTTTFKDELLIIRNSADEKVFQYVIFTK